MLRSTIFPKTADDAARMIVERYVQTVFKPTMLVPRNPFTGDMDEMFTLESEHPETAMENYLATGKLCIKVAVRTTVDLQYLWDDQFQEHVCYIHHEIEPDRAIEIVSAMLKCFFLFA